MKRDRPRFSVDCYVAAVQLKPIVSARDAFQSAFTQTRHPTLPILSLNVTAPAKQEVVSLNGVTHDKLEASFKPVR